MDALSARQKSKGGDGRRDQSQEKQSIDDLFGQSLHLGKY